ncbi:hypothetical protein HDU76_002861 [Blyttiomyces sp. JEL0837]|nr:hypothetical protein HDU76_002861 [Blyttiomyces sp. JEL0837]
MESTNTKQDPPKDSTLLTALQPTTTPSTANEAVDIKLDIPKATHGDSASHSSVSNTISSGKGLTLSWSKVNYSIEIGSRKKRTEKVLLSNMDGVVKPGEVVAIIGGSGAGKTTLLNCLAGRLGPGALSGEILINGSPRQKKTWRKVAAFVEQEEVLFRNLTVKETLSYAAKLRLPRTLTPQEKEQRVDSIISELGLTACQNTYIGDSDKRGISGGEKKRVSIGMELVTEPDILFLDEPTSGLDAFTAVNIISTIAKLAKNPEHPRTCLLTIHQPRTDILELFDKIIILAAGKTVFFGKLDDALKFFDECGYPLPPKTNPSDHFLDVATLDLRSPERQSESTKRIDKFVEAWELVKNKTHNGQVDKKNGDGGGDGFLVSSSTAAAAVGGDGLKEWEKGSRYASSWGTQFVTLLERNMKDVLRDVPTIAATIGQGIFITIIMGSIFWQVKLDKTGVQNRIGALFFLVTNQTFGTVMPTLAVLPLQRPIIKRERSAGMYRASAAYLAKWISTIPLIVAGALILAVPVYWMVGFQHDAAKFFTFLAIILVHSLSAMTMGLMIGSAVKDVRLGQILGPLVIVIFLIFAGQLLNLDSIPIVFRWIQWVSIMTYSNKALNQNEFTGLVFDCGNTGGGLCDPTGEAALQTFGFDNPHGVWSCIAVNLGLMAAFLGAGYFLFLKTSKPLLRLK